MEQLKPCLLEELKFVEPVMDLKLNLELLPLLAVDAEAKDFKQWDKVLLWFNKSVATVTEWVKLSEILVWLAEDVEACTAMCKNR
jgi:hypothetical protein